MKEQESNPKTPKDFVKEDSGIFSKLDKLSAIALEQNKITPSNEAVVQKEKDAFEGNSEASSFLEQLGEEKDQQQHLLHQNENLRLSNEKLTLENENLRLKNQLLQHKNEYEKILDSERTEYTKKLFNLTVSWLIIVVIFVLATGLSFYTFNNSGCENCIKFKLSDNILIAFITSTTATVIGIFIIVAKWLFPPQNNKEGSGDKKK